MNREEGYARCIELLGSGDPAYKPRALARQFLTHFDGRRPSAADVARLAAEWMAAVRPAPSPDGRVRCTDCKHCPARPGGRCQATGAYGRGHGHWRRCEAFVALGGPLPAPVPMRPRLTIESAREALRTAGLWALISQFGALSEGRCGLQLRASATDEQAAAIYRIAGLRVDDDINLLPERTAEPSRRAPPTQPSALRAA